MEYLPSNWTGKRVLVRFKDAGNLEATLAGSNEGGMNIEATMGSDTEEGPTRRAFIPWTSVRYVELLEELQGEDDELLMDPAW